MSFGGKDTQETRLPDWVTQASQRGIAEADRIAGIGYTPYVGPDVAALSSGEMAAHRGNMQAAEAFGLPVASMDLPQAQDFNGIQAYSSHPLYEAALAELKQKYPGNYAQLMGQSVPQQQPQQDPRLAEAAELERQAQMYPQESGARRHAMTKAAILRRNAGGY